MALRIQLINNKLGSFVIDKADPIDINALPKTIKRSEQFHGIIYEIIFDVDFIKAGKQFLKAAYETDGGIDAIVIVNIFELNTNLRKWELQGTGQVDFNRREEGEITITVNIEQTGNERKIINMMEVDVNLDTNESENGTALPPLNDWEILHHSKTIQKEFNTTPSDEGEFQQLGVATFTFPDTGPVTPTATVGVVVHAQIDNTNILNEELKEGYTMPFGFIGYSNPFATDQIGGVGDLTKYTTFLSDPARLETRNQVHDVTEDGETEIDIVLRMRHKVTAIESGGDVDIGGDGCLGQVEVFSFIEKRDKDDNIIYIDLIGSWNMSGVGGTERESAWETKNYNLTENAVIGDKYFVYNTFRVYGTYGVPNIGDGNGIVIHDFITEADETVSHINFKSLTTAPSSIVLAPLIYEAVERCVQFYTNEVDCFISELLGRTDIGYLEDGKASLIEVPNGLRLRGIDIRPVFANLKYLLDFINSRYCIGFGFEVIGGKKIFVVEELAYFYNKMSKSISLGKVFDPKVRTNPKGYYNVVEYGYTTKMNVKQSNGLDEFNTLRRSLIPVINTKNKLPIASDMITAGHLIEWQRRLNFSTSTIDSEYDDRLFAIVVIRDGLGFKTKTNEGYDLVDNIISPETAYNLDLAPSECLKAWLPVIASSLVLSERKEVKFNYGEVNFILIRQKTGEVQIIAENGNFDVTNIEPIWENDFYTIPKHKFTMQQMKLIEANPFGYIEFEDRKGNKFEGFISSNPIERESGKNEGEFNLLKVHRKII